MTGLPQVLPIVLGVLAGLVPAMAWLAQPPSVATGALCHAFAILAAFHGLGRAVSAWAGDEDAPAELALVWGLATFLALAGVLIASGIYGPGARTVLVVGGCMLGAGWFARNIDAGSLRGAFTARRVLVGITFTIVAAVVVLAAAGHWRGYVDADADYLGQIRRLADTGALDDSVGFPRTASLGGQLALGSLVATLEARTLHLVDRGVLLAMVVFLVAMTAFRRLGFGLATMVLPLLLVAIPAFPDEPSARWSLVALMVGSALSLQRARERQADGSAYLVVLVAAAAATLAHAAIAFAGVVAVGLWRVARTWDRRPRWVVGVVIAAVVVLPYLVAMARATAAGPLDPELWGRHLDGLGRRALIGLVVGAAWGLLVARLPSSSSMESRLAQLAIAASFAGVGVLSPSWSAAMVYLAAAGIAAVMLFLLTHLGALADDDTTPPQRALAVAVVLTTALVGIVSLARFPIGRVGSWPVRASAAFDDARALTEARSDTTSLLAIDYARAQATIPAGSRIGLWVSRPDLVDYTRHEVVDLRTVDARVCIDATHHVRRSSACARIALVVRSASLSHLLVSTDALPVPASLGPIPPGVHGSVHALKR